MCERVTHRPDRTSDVYIDVKLTSSFGLPLSCGNQSSICITSRPHDTDASTDVRLVREVAPFLDTNINIVVSLESPVFDAMS
ncbi:hypothetical protein JOB18_008745 [Solea senegalensis]|uniref:Uncharacterized protein n=1 Tax=Solea senegalensis TaxID=28829 RepID=A0AAV6S2U8_SOLSE|nr:hypothetical protein JOB18_008745 [Solea senegalensis]